MSTYTAEFVGGPRDGQVRAVGFHFTALADFTPESDYVYILDRDSEGAPAKTKAGHLRYNYRRLP